jgi:fumarate hydratase class II
MNLFEGISSQDAAVELSGQLNTLVANDLRWMNSGPLAGIPEIELPKKGARVNIDLKR